MANRASCCAWIVAKACETPRSSKRRWRKNVVKRIGKILSGSASANMHRARPTHIVLLLVVARLSKELFLLFIHVIFFFSSTSSCGSPASRQPRLWYLPQHEHWTLSSKRQPHMHACTLNRQERQGEISLWLCRWFCLLSSERLQQKMNAKKR